MAEAKAKSPAPKTEDKSKAPASKMKFFRCRQQAGLSILVNDSPDDDATNVEEVRFTPYVEQWKGDTVRVGYLATDNAKALKTLADNPFVEEISEKEFKDATESEDSRPASL